MTSYKTVSNTIISNLNVKLLHEERRYNDCRIKKELLGMVLTSYNEKMLNPFKSYSTSVFLPNVVHSHANLIENPILNKNMYGNNKFVFLFLLLQSTIYSSPC